MKMLKNNKTLQIFIIGLLLGALFFVVIYGFDVLNVCNDAWLLTGRDLQQHYIGWKFFRNADCSILTPFLYMRYFLNCFLPYCLRRFSILGSLA